MAFGKSGSNTAGVARDHLGHISKWHAIQPLGGMQTMQTPDLHRSLFEQREDGWGLVVGGAANVAIVSGSELMN